MDLDEIIAELKRQRHCLDDAILCLAQTHRPSTFRGRPPKWLKNARAHGLLQMDEASGRLVKDSTPKSKKIETAKGASEGG